MNKKLLGNSEILEILVDSESIDNALHEGNEDVKRILKYFKSNFLNVIRSPFPTSFKELQLIPGFIEIYDKKGNLHEIEINNDSEYSKTLVDYESNYIKSVGQKIFNKESLKNDEIDALNLFFVYATLNNFNRDNTHILLTNNGFLLKNRLELYHHASSLSEEIKDHLDIVSANEARELIGLFLRYHHKYLLSAKPESNTQYGCNRGLWYWYLFRLKIPNFHVGALIDEPFLDAFSTRFVYLLRSVDEIGFQYYKGVNNDTLDDMMYHFNYSISLITGIFDSLALVTKNKYRLEYRGDDIPQRTSLNPKAGKDFLRVLREENSELRTHIHNFVNIIKLVYELRELVVHGKLLEKSRFSSGLWKINVLKIDKSVLMYFPRNNRRQKYKPVTEWGLYILNDEFVYLEPFDFIKRLVKLLFNFTNEYLRLLGFNDFIEELRSNNNNDNFVKDIDLLKEDSLILWL